jgi:hypothetical protein
MKFYFDIEFLKSLQKVDELDEFIFDDFKHFISNSLKNEDCFIVGEDNLDILKLSEIIFYRLLNQNSKSLKFINKNDFLLNLDKSNDTYFKYVFVNEITSAQNVRDNYGFYSYSSKELNEVWMKFHSRRSIEDLERYIDDKKSKYFFSSWEDLIEFSLPINTFILSDQYLFEYLDSFRFNFHELLKNIGLKPLKSRKINIVVITSDKVFESEKDKKDESKIISFLQLNYHKKIEFNNVLTQLEINDLLFEIAFHEAKKIILELINESDFNFSLIKLDKNSSPKSNDAHFRACLTNTTFLQCGHSFTLFGPHSKIRKKEYFKLSSFLWDGPRNNASNGIINVAIKALKNKKWNIREKVYTSPNKILKFNEDINGNNFFLINEESLR